MIESETKANQEKKIVQ